MTAEPRQKAGMSVIVALLLSLGANIGTFTAVIALPDKVQRLELRIERLELVIARLNNGQKVLE